MTSAGYEQLVEFLERQFTGIDRRFDDVNGQITELRHDMHGHFDEIDRRLECLEQERLHLRVAHLFLEGRLPVRRLPPLSSAHPVGASAALSLLEVQDQRKHRASRGGTPAGLPLVTLDVITVARYHPPR